MSTKLPTGVRTSCTQSFETNPMVPTAAPDRPSWIIITGRKGKMGARAAGGMGAEGEGHKEEWGGCYYLAYVYY